MARRPLIVNALKLNKMKTIGKGSTIGYLNASEVKLGKDEGYFFTIKRLPVLAIWGPH